MSNMVTDAPVAQVEPVVDGGDAPLLHFPQPLVPFGGVKDYVLEQRPEEEPFAWLRAVEQPGLALVVAPYQDLVGEPGPDRGA